MDKKIRRFISFDKIFCDTISVKQKIKQDYIYDFVSANLNISNYNLIHIFYHEKSKLYSILAIKSLNTNIVIEPQLLATLYKETLSSYTLFIVSSFFVLFYKKNLIYCKSIDKTQNHNDIKQYVEHIFKIDILNLQIISDEQYSKIQKDFHNIKPLNWLNKNSSVFMQNIYYKVYIVVLCLIVGGYAIYKYLHSKNEAKFINNHIVNYEKFIKYNTNKLALIPKIKNYFSIVAHNNIKIVEAKIDTNKVSLEVSTNKKQNIYKLVDELEYSNIELKYILFDDNKKVFNARVVFDTF